jgi:hypothetical protein
MIKISTFNLHVNCISHVLSDNAHCINIISDLLFYFSIFLEEPVLDTLTAFVATPIRIFRITQFLYSQRLAFLLWDCCLFYLQVYSFSVFLLANLNFCACWIIKTVDYVCTDLNMIRPINTDLLSWVGDAILVIGTCWDTDSRYSSTHLNNGT